MVLSERNYYQSQAMSDSKSAENTKPPTKKEEAEAKATENGTVEPTAKEVEEDSGRAQIKMRKPIGENANMVAERNAGVNGAISRGLAALAETEMEENLEEIKVLDTQLDHLNECLDKFEKRVTDHSTKIQEMLDSQKEARLKRRASFQQRLQQSAAEDEDFHTRVKTMLGRCNQVKRMSVPEFSPEVEDMLRNAQLNENGTADSTQSAPKPDSTKNN